MFRPMLLATAVLCAFTVSAEARQHSAQHHHHHRFATHRHRVQVAEHGHHARHARRAGAHRVSHARRHYAGRVHRYRHALAHHRGYARAWCGIYMAHYFGKSDRSLALAREWARVGVSAGGPGVGVVVVWPHHVGVITGRAANGQWIVHSGNDSGAVRTRPRSLAGAIAFRHV